MAKYFDFNSKFGWPEIIAIACALAATVISALSWQESRAARLDSQQARIEARAKVVVDESFTAVDASRVNADGTGRLVWYVRYSFTNRGEEPTSLRGAWNRTPLPIVLAMRDGVLVQASIPVSIYAGEGLEWAEVVRDQEYFAKNAPISWEALSNLNLTVPGGQSRSLALIYVIDNPDTPTEGYLINHRFVFSDGNEYPVDYFLQIKGNTGDGI